ncbi:hypothetical protein J2W14_004137 [Pseudarthrobacter oxydans]|nr:hypothetical protein [Pseudarthrobacter oxydans]
MWALLGLGEIMSTKWGLAGIVAVIAVMAGIFAWFLLGRY